MIPNLQIGLKIPKRIEYCQPLTILLYCFHTAGVLHIFGPGTSFYRKSKINIKRKPNYETGWFHT